MDFPLRRKISLKFYTKVEVNNLYSTMCNVNIEYNFEMVCNWILYSVDLEWKWQKSQSLSCQNCSKSHIICHAKNVENHAIFVEGFWPEFYARGRFMRYSMSVSCEVHVFDTVSSSHISLYKKPIHKKLSLKNSEN